MAQTSTAAKYYETLREKDPHNAAKVKKMYEKHKVPYNITYSDDYRQTYDTLASKDPYIASEYKKMYEKYNGDTRQVNSLYADKIGESAYISTYLPQDSVSYANTGSQSASVENQKNTQGAYSELPAASAAYLERYNPGSYEAFYSKSPYIENIDNYRTAADAAMRNYGAQVSAAKNAVEQSASLAANDAYVNYMTAQKQLPQQLAAAGFTGGLADSQKLALALGYQGDIARINSEKLAQLADIESELAAYRAQIESETAQQTAAQNNAATQEYNRRISELMGYDYNLGQSAREFEYQKERDAVNDAYLDREFEYARDRDAVNDAYLDREFEYARERDAVNDQMSREMLEYERTLAAQQAENQRLNESIEYAYTVRDWDLFERLTGTNADYMRELDRQSMLPETYTRYSNTEKNVSGSENVDYDALTDAYIKWNGSKNSVTDDEYELLMRIYGTEDALNEEKNIKPMSYGTGTNMGTDQITPVASVYLPLYKYR